MWASIPAQDCLVSFDLWVYNFCLWAYSFWQICKVFSYQYKEFSTLAIWNANIWPPYVVSRNCSAFTFSDVLCTTLGSITLCMRGLLLSRDSWWPLCIFLEVFFAWLPPCSWTQPPHITFAFSNTAFHFLSSYCWTLSFLLLRLVPENCVWAFLVFIFWGSQSYVV